MDDLLIPIVFPDYRITVEIPKTEIDILPGVTFDNFTTPSYKDKFSNLGHAGALFINGRNGETKYYEYGRYDPPANLGFVVKIKALPNVVLKNGKMDYASLKNTLSVISKMSGQNGRIQGVFIRVPYQYASMLAYAESRESQNTDPNRTPYHLQSNSCVHFVKELALVADVPTPWMFDPRPNSYIGEFRDDFPDLDYDGRSLEIEGIGKF